MRIRRKAERDLRGLEKAEAERNEGGEGERVGCRKERPGVAGQAARDTVP